MNDAANIGAPGYAYSAGPTKNPLRYALAVWRLITGPSTDAATGEAAIVELGFARSRFGRRLARWGEVLAHLQNHPDTAAAVRARRTVEPINLETLAGHPEGSLGCVFASHCRTRGINPNLVHIPPDSAEDWLLNHLFQTHDIWHIVTGWPNDTRGEVGLGGFYCGQLKSPPFFAFMVGLILLKTVWRRENTDEVFGAFTAGYRAGQTAQPLFGARWDELWRTPLDEVRARFGIEPVASLEEMAKAA